VIETSQLSLVRPFPPPPLLIFPAAVVVAVSSRTVGEVMRSSKGYVFFSGGYRRVCNEKDYF